VASRRAQSAGGLPAAAGRGGLVAGLSAAANRRGLLHRQTVAATAFAGLAGLVMVAAAVARWVLAVEDPAAAASLAGWLGLVDLGAPRGAMDDRTAAGRGADRGGARRLVGRHRRRLRLPQHALARRPGGASTGYNSAYMTAYDLSC
jgi:hypothetical protein